MLQQILRSALIVLCLGQLHSLIAETDQSQWPPPDIDLADGTELGQRFREFVTAKESEMRTVARTLDITVPPEATLFLEAVNSNCWSSASQVFKTLKVSTQHDNVAVILTGIHDIQGLYSSWAYWDGELVELFIQETLRDIPSGSIFLGGTDEGRFFISMSAATSRKGDLAVITQNQIGDQEYAEYVRTALAHKLHVPTPKELAVVWEEFKTQVRSGSRTSQDYHLDQNGQLVITGASGIMELNGEFIRAMFDSNIKSHGFYVQESYVLEWMYDYMIPHGLILKLEAEKIQSLSPAIVNSDMEYWRKLETRLNSMPTLHKYVAARFIFSKARCAIAGLYSHHAMWAEAEAAFQQALRILPASPEANFRLADMYKAMGDADKAEKVIRDYVRDNPSSADRRQAEHYIAALRSTSP